MGNFHFFDKNRNKENTKNEENERKRKKNEAKNTYFSRTTFRGKKKVKIEKLNEKSKIRGKAKNYKNLVCQKMLQRLCKNFNIEVKILLQVN